MSPLLSSRPAAAVPNKEQSAITIAVDRDIARTPNELRLLSIAVADVLGNIGPWRRRSHGLEGHRRRLRSHRHAFAQRGAGDAGLCAGPPHGRGLHPPRTGAVLGPCRAQTAVRLERVLRKLSVVLRLAELQLLQAAC